MKRNKTTNRLGRSGISPYRKYSKRPAQYSAAYHDWKRAAMAGQVREVSNGQA